ncbi:hypothetical protein BDY21DRAFT_346950 [Lineolata rhizophorae]|uniref:Uncharacterized protein n=1 Tax=Lineolata rhizophorae TaxID=578093 RepID=A0A6A6NY52_9PEZI|nr:hypothetical protein BDY21DRAFT_346950 [Lineolata rhizophorae]
MLILSAIVAIVGSTFPRAPPRLAAAHARLVASPSGHLIKIPPPISDLPCFFAFNDPSCWFMLSQPLYSVKKENICPNMSYRWYCPFPLIYLSLLFSFFFC